MKLTLPFGLLAALMSLAYAQDASETPSVTNPSDGGYTNSGTNCNIYISQNVIWTEDHNYEEFGSATYLSVGSHAGAGSLSVENGATVNIANCLNIGGRGYQYPVPEGETPQSNTGRVHVGAGATLEVGASSSLHDVAGSQLHVGSGGEGSLEVDGGTLISNYLLNVGYSAAGTMSVSNKGNVEVRLPARMTDSFGNAGAASSSCFYIGSYGGTGVVTLDDSSLSVSAENGRYAQTYVGLQGSGTLHVTNGSTADLGDLTVVGYTSGAEGHILVNGSTLHSGTVYVGYSGGSAELKAENGSMVDVQGDMYVNDTVSVSTAASMEVSGDVVVYGDVTVTKANLSVGGTYENHGTTTVTLDEGNSFTVGEYINHGTTTITAAAGTECCFANLTLAGGSMTLKGAGNYTLGASSEGEGSVVTQFNVSGTAVTTQIDVSSLGSANFTVDDSAAFMLNFDTESLAGMAAGDARDFSLHLIVGSSALVVNDLEALLSRTDYVFASQAAAAVMSLEADGTSASMTEFSVEGARYTMVETESGRDLVWTGTVRAASPVPEPTTATLSLLALAGLAARRRRR